MSAYTDHRARRMWAAHEYQGWDMPPHPDGRKSAGRLVGSRVADIAPGFYPNSHPRKAYIDTMFKARERAQNRKHFQ